MRANAHIEEGRRWFELLLAADDENLPEEWRWEVELHRAFLENWRFAGDPGYFGQLAARVRTVLGQLPDGHRATALGWWALAVFEQGLEFDSTKIDAYSEEVIGACARHPAPLVEALAHVTKSHARMYERDLPRRPAGARGRG